MAGDNEQAGQEPKEILLDGEPIIMFPKTEEEVEKATAQHTKRIVQAILAGCEMVRHATHEMKESNQPRDLRILSASWRHLTAEEKTTSLMSPFMGTGRIAADLLRQEMNKSSMEQKPLSERMN